MNLFEIEDKVLNKELVTILAKGENIRIERIVSEGETSPAGFWYDQDEDEMVFLLQGWAKLEFEDRVESLKEGDCLLIPAHEKHRVIQTSQKPPTIWLCVFGNNLKGGLRTIK